MSRLEEGSIHSIAPVRFDFGGGPTDVDPFKSQEGGFVVNAAINRFAEVQVIPRKDSSIVITSNDIGVREAANSLDELELVGSLRLIKAAVKYFELEGLAIKTKVDAPVGSGLGASAALAVALSGALRTFTGEDFTQEELVEDALHMENVLLGNINGGQDQYASALGGFNAFNFNTNGVDVNSLSISPETVARLESRSVLFYSGASHLSGEVLDQIMGEYSAGNPKTTTALREMKDLTHGVEEALVNGDVDGFGNLIKDVGEVQKSYHPAVMPPQVGELFDAVRDNGVVGGKLAGAGGGGCIYLFCEDGKKEQVVDTLQRKDIAVMEIGFASEGITVWQADKHV